MYNTSGDFVLSLTPSRESSIDLVLHCLTNLFVDCLRETNTLRGACRPFKLSLLGVSCPGVYSGF